MIAIRAEVLPVNSVSVMRISQFYSVFIDTNHRHGDNSALIVIGNNV